MRMNFVAGVVALALGAAAGLAQQQPKVANAQVTERATQSLQREVAAVTTASWLGYAIPTERPLRTSWNDDTVYLEGSPVHVDVKPERKAGDPQPFGVVLLRVAGGKISRVLLEQSDRQIDGGGLPFVWLTGVHAADSVAVLKSAVEASIAQEPLTVPSSSAGDSAREAAREEARKVRRVYDGGMTAIALTDGPEATAALREWTAAKYPLAVRDKAAFWLANERGREGFETVSSLLKSDKDDALRQKLVFDLTLVRGESQKAAVDALIAAAKTDAAPKVKSQAQFWLAQMAGKKMLGGNAEAVRVLTDEARNDPEASMRKSALFALSRLPEEQGVPELIQVASSNKDAATRKEAIFWLGKAKDPRALAYLEKVVKE